jgi:hypothetical protein
MNYPATYDASQAHITQAGNVFQVLGADGAWDEAATAAAYQSWQEQVLTIAANASLGTLRFTPANASVTANTAVTATVTK